MSQIKQSTWREQTITIAPQSVEEIVFNDTMPNHFYINNLSASILYFGITVIPKENIYEMMVDSFGENIYARQIGTKRCRIYNSGTNPAQLILITFEEQFNPSTLAKAASGSSSGGGGGGSFDGVIRGFSVPLPAGDNNIGRVKVTEMPTMNINLTELPAGNNKIGKVDVVTMPPLAEGTSHIGSVSIDGGVDIDTIPPITIASMPPVEVSSQPTRQSHQYFEASVGTSEVVFNITDGTNQLDVVTINFISNDDTTNDLFVSFDNTPATTTPGNGLNGIIRLKPGETLTDVHRKCNKIRFIREAGNGTVRVLGV